MDRLNELAPLIQGTAFVAGIGSFYFVWKKYGLEAGNQLFSTTVAAILVLGVLTLIADRRAT